MNFPIRRTLGNLEHNIGNAIGGVLKNGYNGQYGPNMSPDTVQHMKNNAQAGQKAMMDAAGKKMKSYKKGGMVHQTGPAFLHKGEYVIPKAQVNQAHKNWILSDSGAMKS